MMNIQNLLKIVVSIVLLQYFAPPDDPTIELETKRGPPVSTLSTTPVFGVGGSLIQIYSYKQI